MDGLKGFAEIAEHILYEALGLVIPGAVFVLAVAFAWDPALGQRVVDLAQRHPWLALGGAYVTGYPVQSLSRPLARVFEWLLQRPTRVLAAAGLVLGARARRAVGAQVAAFEGCLLRRHAHQHAQDARTDREAAASQRVAFTGLLHDRWARQLDLPTESRLTDQQVKDLCYSALTGDERKSLIRFRAAASLTRAVAAAVVVATAIWTATLVQQPSRLTWSSVAVIELLIVAFYGLMERGDMYDRLWAAVLQSQALGVGAHTRCPPPAARADGAAAEPRAPPQATPVVGDAVAHSASVRPAVPATMSAHPQSSAPPLALQPDPEITLSTTAHLPSSPPRRPAIAGGASPGVVPKE